MTRAGLLLAATCLVAAAACGGNEGDGAADAGDVTATTAAAPTTVPAAVTTTAETEVADTTEAPTKATSTEPASTEPATTEPATTEPDRPLWAKADVEGCVCSNGSPLPIFERVADPSKVVLYFEGGGACFNAATCDPNGNPVYSVDRSYLAPRNLESLGGYFDTTNPENPLADHSFVYVPYCTGDVHVGDTTTDYGNGIVIEHRGHANAVKALDYLAARYPEAEQLLVTGESAGSVPTPVVAAMASDLLPDTEIVTFGDSSGAYPDVDAITSLIGEAWGTLDAVPDWPEAANVGPSDWSFPEQYIIAGQHAPDVRFGRFDYANDEAQVFYAQLAGLAPAELVTLIDGNADRIEAAGVPLATYVAPGIKHTIASSDAL
jgi:hypothetical protein